MIVVKLKCKAEYHSHVLFKPSFVGSFFRFLKLFNHWYSDIEIDLNNISETGHETRNLIEKMIKNISEALNIVLEQNYLPDLTNNSEHEEADQNSPE